MGFNSAFKGLMLITSNNILKEKCVSHNRKAFSRFITADSYAWNITQNTGSNAV
jgi:hypothetical protein